MRATGRTWSLTFLPAVGLCIGCYCFLVTRHRILWSDELFGWMLVSDPSWKHMLRAWEQGADGGGLAFYALARTWLMIFGRQVLAFRAFSAAGVYLGFAAMWFLLRRFYQPAVAAMALVVVWFDASVMLWQIVQGRFYGPLVGICACALYMSVRCAQEAESPAGMSWGTLAAVFVVNLLLVNAHPFGLLYSGVLLIGAAFDDALAKRRRPGYYAAVVVPWASLLFFRTQMINSAAVGKPWSWTVKPGWGDLWAVYRPVYAVKLYLLALVLAAVVLASMLWRGRRQEILAGLVKRRSVLIPALLLLVVPVLFWVGSQGSRSYFVDRYFIPYLLGVAVLGAELLSHVFERPLSFKEPLPAALAAVLGLVSVYILVSRSMIPYAKDLQFPSKDFTGNLAAMLPRDEPVVIQRPDMFDVMVYYQRQPDLHMVYPLDWQLALSPDSPRWMVSASHELENWKRVGYFSADIVKSEAFLATHSHFAVVVDDLTPWFERRIVTQPGWRLQKLGTFKQAGLNCVIWQVSR